MFNIKRFPHILQAKKRTVVPDNFIFFDCETRVKNTKNVRATGNHVLWFGCAYASQIKDGKETRVKKLIFTTQAQFWKFVESRLQQHKPLFVYAHNLGFDLTIAGFLELHKKLGIDVGFYTFDSPPTIFKCRWKGHTIVFVDTLNYWTVSLKSLGESLKIAKLEMPDDSAPISDWHIYCMRDVEIIRDAIYNLCRFVKQHDCGGVGMTLASLSFNAYRHKHMKHDIFIHDRIKVCELEREAYYGGLVQCYYVGQVEEKPIYGLDVNSHYPAMMLRKFPCKLIEECENVSLSKLEMLLKSKGVIARVSISTNSETFPFREKKRLQYVTGRFTTTLCGPELQRALSKKCIIKVWKIAVYDMQPIFYSFVKYFYNLRQQYKAQGKHVDSYFAKIFLNSLYGKFGQQGVAWVDLSQEILNNINNLVPTQQPLPEMKLESIPIESFGYWGFTPLGAVDELYLRNVINGVQIKLAVDEHYESFPAIAAYVTSYGREHLLKLVEIAGKHNVYYVDTDSLFVNKIGKRNLMKAKTFGETELGKLKQEKTTDNLILYGPKDYVFGDTTTIKGVKKDAKEIAPATFEQLQFEGLKAIVRRGGKSFVNITKIQKTLKRRYDKGTVGKDGWVRPFIRSDF